MAALLADGEVASWLDAHPGWERSGDEIRRTVEASSFLDGIELVRRVAGVAEERDHHPDIDIRWRKVTFALSTHSEGGLTQKDLDLAAEIDRLASAG